MAERSAGKDSVTGHWEIAGLVLDRPFPTFPHGFPAEVIAEFERRIGRGSLANTVASGTVIIEQLGDEHLRTGKPTNLPATEPVATFPIDVRGGDVYVDTETTLNGVTPA